MTDAQLAELDQALTTTLKSTTIEWAINLRICDMLQANPSLARIVMGRVDARLRKEDPISVLLALGLLEMVGKNCGLAACRAVDDNLAEALVAVVKKRETWFYGLGRNLHKSGVGSWLPQGMGITEGARTQWMQASNKVLELLQLWADAFMLHQAELQPIFGAYRQLRQEGYKFPKGERGAAAGLCLVAGAEESPAFLAGAASAPGSAEIPGSASAPRSPQLPAPSATSSAAGSAEVPARAAAATQAAQSLFQGLSLATDRIEPSSTGVGACAATPEVDLLGVDDPLEQGGANHDVAGGGGHEPLREAIAVEDDAHGAEGALRCSRRALDAWSAAREDVEERRRLARGLRETRDVVLRYIEQPEEGAPEDVSEVLLAALLEMLEQLNEALATAPAAVVVPSSSSIAVPAPPTEAPPDREQQELYDLMLARYLQARENEAFLAAMSSYEEADAALARRLAAEEGTLSGAQVFEPPSVIIASCSQCGAGNQLQRPSHGAGRSTGRFVCYRCGFTQRMPPPAIPSGVSFAAIAAGHAPLGATASHSSHMRLGGDVGSRPSRNAPAPRVMTAGAAPELVIDDVAHDVGDEDVATGVAPSSSSTAPTPHTQKAAYGQVVGADLSRGLLSGAESGAGGGDARGGYKAPSLGRSVKALAGSVGGLVGSSSHHAAVRRLGDGTPAGDYSEMDAETGASLLGGPPPPSSKRHGKSASSMLRALAGKSSTASADAEESLLERVPVTGEWELIRPPGGGRQYWYNTSTQVSQWEPPAEAALLNHMKAARRENGAGELRLRLRTMGS